MPHPIITRLKTVLALIILCVLSSTTLADTPLNKESIQQWIKSQKAFAQWGDENSEQLSTYQGSYQAENNPLDISAQQMIKPLEATGLRASAESLLRQFGFSSLEEWARLTLRITQTAAAIQVEQQKQNFNNSELEALKNSGRLSKEQQTMVSKAIQQNRDMLNYLEQNVSEADKEAIRPFLGELENLLN